MVQIFLFYGFEFWARYPGNKSMLKVAIETVEKGKICLT